MFFSCFFQNFFVDLAFLLTFPCYSEIVALIEATGAMGLYHEGYAAVSKKASVDYLDR